MSGDALKPGQVFLLERLAAVNQEQPARRLAPLLKGDRHERAHLELLLGRPGQARQGLKWAGIPAVPAETGSLAYKGIPANCGVQIVKQKAVRPGKRHAFWNKPLALTRFQPPEKNAFEIRVPVKQQA